MYEVAERLNPHYESSPWARGPVSHLGDVARKNGQAVILDDERYVADAMVPAVGGVYALPGHLRFTTSLDTNEFDGAVYEVVA
jgi:hypothetical protein